MSDEEKEKGKKKKRLGGCQLSSDVTANVSEVELVMVSALEELTHMKIFHLVKENVIFSVKAVLKQECFQNKSPVDVIQCPLPLKKLQTDVSHQ
jgi:hypothetical protein